MVKIFVLLFTLIIGSCVGISQNRKATAQKGDKKAESFEVEKTDAEWKAELSEMEYYVLRKAATESPFTSDWLDNKQTGTYTCKGCGTPLFRSENKFDSGTGWPSFDQEIEGNVGYDVDYKIGYARTEEHCAKCGGHLGHVFNDGPSKTTGKRHCINGVALAFVPDEK